MKFGKFIAPLSSYQADLTDVERFVSVLGFPVEGWETAQTELGPPMGGIGWAIGSLGRDVQGGGLIATAILRPAVLLEEGK